MRHTGKIQDIIALCVELTEEKKGHFFFDYQAHVNWISVHAYPVDNLYAVGQSKELEGFEFGSLRIYLNEPEATEQLEHLIKKLEGML